MRTTRAFLATGLLVGWTAAAACAHRAPVATPPGAAAGSADTTRRAATTVPLRVESHHGADVVVYVVRSDVRQRIGTVTAGSTRDFALPARYVGDVAGISLVAAAIGGDAVRSDRVIVRAGMRVVWTLESGLARSSLAVY